MFQEACARGNEGTELTPLDVSRSTARAYVRKIKEYEVLVAQEEFAFAEDDL